MAKKRRSPLKRANTAREIQTQLDRYNRLLDKAVRELLTITKRVETYRKKANHYQARKDALRNQAVAELQTSSRPARGLELRSD